MPYSGAVADVLQFVGRLTVARISFSVRIVRDDALMVEAHVPGERWEVEFMADGTVEVERFSSTGEIGDYSLLEELFEEFSD
ncbi:MAG: hypothetical protein R2695_07640 [Acidimicrobiales bacterium]